jgi:CRISPR/Cas system-associated endonuclease Cas1
MIKVTKDTLPQVKEKYPFIYLERGRLEIDDSSVMWVDCEGQVIRLPIATINCLLLGPGTSITDESVKVLAASNCNMWLQVFLATFSLILHFLLTNQSHQSCSYYTTCDSGLHLEHLLKISGQFC